MLIDFISVLFIIEIAFGIDSSIFPDGKVKLHQHTRFVSSSNSIDCSHRSDPLTPMISFINSSSQMHDVSFQMTNTLISSESTSMSFLKLRNCEIHFTSGSTIHSPLISLGSIVILDRISISTEGSVYSVLTIPESEPALLNHGKGACLHILSSRLQNIKITGSFSSSGILDTEIIRGSIFSNVSLVEGAKCTSLCRECILENTNIFDGENSLYGVIVTGLVANMGNLFLCENCTFERLVSNHHSKIVNMITAYSSEEFSTTEILSDALSYEFRRCRFVGCVSVNGGGLSLVGSSDLNESLIVFNCTFERCEATQFGGGIYCSGVTSLHVDGCIFDHCSAAQGGGVYLEGIDVSNCKDLSVRVWDCV